MKTQRELSKLSYTNKDFNSIYTELLEYAKKVSYKWDPSASDESDPGVVLLKLASIIGDKNNYNIDKSILELMPASVTQLPAARQIFEQCGYSMKHYIAATSVLNLTIKSELGKVEEGVEYSYRIPRFTTFSDNNASVVYTTTEEITMKKNTDIPVNIIEGVPVTYSINNESLITSQYLDNNNRLYFTDMNVAENGIFITNARSDNSLKTNYEEWVKVDNLEIQTGGTRCYKFGLTLDGSSCFIEFPRDIEFLMDEGLRITYIRTNGVKGNVTAGAITKFYADTKIIKFPDISESLSEEVSVTSEDVTIKNILPILNGTDPESIDDAYRSYKRVRDTFNTLVSLKDYTDYMITSESASNGFVCDRTNDIQNCYTMRRRSPNGSTYLTTEINPSDKYVFKKTGEETYEVVEALPSMDAFSLCVYALQYVANPTNVNSFKSSFMLTDGSEAISSFSSENLKSIQHNFNSLEKDKILLLKNKYSIQASIVPKYKLSITEKNQVKYNAEQALCGALNSKQMTFGSPADIDIIVDTLINSDERVKSIANFITPKYETWAVYKNSNNEFSEMRIDDESFDGGFVKTYVTKNTFNKSLYYFNITSKNIERVGESDTYDSNIDYYIFNEDYHDLWIRFRSEIFAKNIISGVTPLYSSSTPYTFSISQKDTQEYTGITHITTNTELIGELDEESNSVLFPELIENESIMLTCPNLVLENKYSNYVKMIYNIGGGQENMYLQPNSAYELSDGDYFLFFWKSGETSEYNYARYDHTDDSLAKFIKTVEMSLPYIQPDMQDYKENIDQLLSTCTGSNGVVLDSTLNEFIAGLNSEKSFQTLTGTKEIQTLNINKILLNNNINGTSSVYWILNSRTKDNKYVLFQPDQSSYTLQPGEYLIYTNDSRSTIYLLGQGTLIERTSGWDISLEWSVEAIDYSDISMQGMSILEDKWFKLPKVPQSSLNDSEKQLWAVEQQQIIIGSDHTLKVEYKNSDDTQTILSNTPTNLKNCYIYYTDSDGNTTKVPGAMGNTLFWTAKTILNLSVRHDKYQYLVLEADKRTQSISFVHDDSIINPVTNTPDATERTDIRFLSNKELQLSGGINIPVSLSYVEDVNLLTYNEIDTSEVSDVYYTDFSATVHININESTENTYSGRTELPSFKLVSGKYLLQLSSSQELLELSVSFNSNDNFSASPLFKDSQSAVNKLYRLEVSKDTTIDMTIICTSTSDRTYVEVAPLFCYTNNNLRSVSVGNSSGDETFEQHVLSVLNELDHDEEADYTTNITTPINNPLSSNSFLSSDHFYNKFTICEWDAIVEDNINVYDLVR